MYSSSNFERLFILYKAEAMPGKSMVQESRHQIAPYAALNKPNKRAIGSGISEDILPRNCHRKKGLRSTNKY